MLAGKRTVQVAVALMDQPRFRGRARAIRRGILMRPTRLAIIIGLAILGVVVDNMFNTSPYVMLVLTLGIGSVLVTRWMFDELEFKKEK